MVIREGARNIVPIINQAEEKGPKDSKVNYELLINMGADRETNFF